MDKESKKPNFGQESEKGHREDLAENLEKLDVSDESDVKSATTTAEFSLFVLCVYCTRTILIQSTLNSGIASLSTTSAKFSLDVTTCRHCTKSSDKYGTSVLSRDMLEKSRIYECVRKVAGEKIVVPMSDSMVLSVPLEELLKRLSPECRVCGIETSGTILRNLDNVGRESLIFPHLPGAFL